MAQAIDRAASATFRNGVRPSGILSTKDSLTAEQRGVAENLLQEKFAGSLHAGRPMLLDRDMQWQQLTINPEDAQMLESRAFSVEEICRFFGVPPFMVGRSEEHTSELQSLMRISYAVFCLKKKKTDTKNRYRAGI